LPIAEFATEFLSAENPPKKINAPDLPPNFANRSNIRRKIAGRPTFAVTSQLVAEF